MSKRDRVHAEQVHEDCPAILVQNDSLVLQQAAVEGLSLETSTKSASGFQGVVWNGTAFSGTGRLGGYQVRCKICRPSPEANPLYIGCALTAEEAALKYARHKMSEKHVQLAAARMQLLTEEQMAKKAKAAEAAEWKQAAKAAKEEKQKQAKEEMLAAKAAKQRQQSICMRRLRQAQKAQLLAAREELRQQAEARQKQAAEEQQRLFKEAFDRQQQAGTSAAAQGCSCSNEPMAPPCSSIDDMALSELVQTVLREAPVCSYRCLGLSPGTPLGDARKRYLMLAKRLHPDKAAHADAARAFHAVDAAYHQLQAKSV